MLLYRPPVVYSVIMTNNDSDFFRRRVWERTHGVQQVTPAIPPHPGDPVKHLLIICTANICRSPMVEGLISDHLQREGLDQRVTVSSAGIFGMKGESASSSGVELLATRGIDISDHVARQVNGQMLDRANLILVMEEGHRSAIFARAPQHLYKVLLFSELINEHGDLSDPYRQGREAYERALARMDVILGEGWELLLEKLDIRG